MTVNMSPKNAEGDHVQALQRPAHSLTVSQVLQELRGNEENGLDSQDAKQRYSRYGDNSISKEEGVQPVKILITQVANAMTLILVLAMAVSFGIKSWIEGGVITCVILLNVSIGFRQDYYAQKTMNSLRSLSSPTARVLRDGAVTTIATREVVPGDLVVLKTGDTIPADLRLIEAVNFETDEALLTGESLPVSKKVDVVFEEDTGPGDRLNIAYSSSTVTKGRARGIVIATAMATEIGSIAAALRGNNKRKYSVVRKPDGSASPSRHIQAFGVNAVYGIGVFLGINVGTPLHKKLSRLALLLFGVAVVCAIIVLAANNFARYDVIEGSNPQQEIAIYAVATGLSMIPASLTVILTITMAAGAKRMVQKNVIVRKMDALEALGAITNICSDKTGTLTQGRMITKKAWMPAKGTYTLSDVNDVLNPRIGNVTLDPISPRDQNASEKRPRNEKLNLGRRHSCAEFVRDDHLEDFFKVASLANLAVVHETKGEWKAVGDPTEIAIQVFASRFGWNRAEKTTGQNPAWRSLAEFPFDSDIKKMSVICRESATGKNMVFTKGAVERILESCTKLHIDSEHGPVEMSDEIRHMILENMEAFASLGLRCLALASRSYEQDIEEGAQIPRDEVERNLMFQGLVGIYDPPRKESAGAVKECHEAGISVHMVTGDHPGTARAIAAQVGILPPRIELLSKDVADALVMTASQFDKLSDDNLDLLPVLPLVIARCTPNTKVRMIEALHRRGKFVAMTGDGVNDSPSLKRADVGIAMGQAGSDVAKDASDIILTDDNFASIVNAIAEGRRMFDNIQKFVLHLLSQNVAQAIVLLVGLAFKDDRNISVFPLSPVEILWIIMITSALPDMGLGFEQAAPDIMRRPPVDHKTGVFQLELLFDMVFYGIWIAALCLGAFVLVMWGFGNGQLGSGCNSGHASECELVFRARGTAFACLTWFSLFLAWEMMSLRRSLFYMHPGTPYPLTQWCCDVWSNKFLFWSVIAGFVTIFPVLYLPVINWAVFVHEGIGWEWAIIFIAAALFFVGVEGWKWGKRVYFRRQPLGAKVDDLEADHFKTYLSRATTEMSADSKKELDVG